MMTWLPLDHAGNYSLLFNYSSLGTQFMIKTNNLPWIQKVLRWTLVSLARAIPPAMWNGSVAAKKHIFTLIIIFIASAQGLGVQQEHNL